MSWNDFTTRVSTTQPTVSKTQYYNDMSEIVTKINAIQAKLDTIESNATADQTGAEIVSAINSSVGMINFARLTIASGDLSIAKTSGLQTAIDSKADTSHTHVEADVTNLVNDLLAKAELVHTHSMADITLLSDEFDTKSDTGHKHDHGDCIENGSAEDDDHSKYLSRVTRGAPSKGNVLETQISYDTGVVPIALNDVPRMIDILNVFASGVAGNETGTLDATGNVTLAHGLGTTSFFISGQLLIGGIWEKAEFDISFTDNNNFTIAFGAGLDTIDYKFSWIATENISGATGIPTGLISGQKTGTLPVNGSVQVSHHLASDYMSVDCWTDISTNPFVPEWKNIPVDIEYADDGLSFTANFGVGLENQKYKIFWIKKLL